MEAKAKIDWEFVSSNEEMLLILKALGGRLRDSDIAAAKELGDRLTRHRLHSLEQTASQLRQALGETI